MSTGQHPAEKDKLLQAVRAQEDAAGEQEATLGTCSLQSHNLALTSLPGLALYTPELFLCLPSRLALLLELLGV